MLWMDGLPKLLDPHVSQTILVTVELAECVFDTLTTSPCARLFACGSIWKPLCCVAFEATSSGTSQTDPRILDGFPVVGF